LAIPDGVVNGNWKRERKEMKEKTMRKHGVVYILPIQWWLHPSVFLVVPLCVVRSLTFSHSSTSLYGKCDVVVVLGVILMRVELFLFSFFGRSQMDSNTKGKKKKERSSQRENS
jgi:hypothetical protein